MYCYALLCTAMYCKVILCNVMSCYKCMYIRYVMDSVLIGWGGAVFGQWKRCQACNKLMHILHTNTTRSKHAKLEQTYMSESQREMKGDAYDSNEEAKINAIQSGHPKWNCM